MATIGRPRTSPVLRFWAKVAKSDGCWEWQAVRSSQGYGAFRPTPESKQRSAHCYSWELAFGPIPDGLWVLHRCDNRVCVRPEHLFVGSASDNAQDAIAKGRRRRKGTSAELRRQRMAA
jgi:hypothetical protein